MLNFGNHYTIVTEQKQLLHHTYITYECTCT